MLVRWKIYLGYKYTVINKLMYSVFLSCGIIFNLVTFNESFSMRNLLFAIVSTLCFLLYIRMRDEFRDYEYDKIHHPDRPVPSGQVKLDDLKVLNAINIIILVLINLLAGIRILFVICLALFVLCGRDFFMKSIVSKNRLTILVSHSPVYLILVMYIASFSTIDSVHTITSQQILVSNIFLLPILLHDIGKKTFIPDKEQIGYKTYSSLMGRKGVVWFTLIIFVLHSVMYQFFFMSQSGIKAVLIICSLQIIYSIATIFCWVGCLFSENIILNSTATALARGYMLFVYLTATLYGIISFIM